MQSVVETHGIQQEQKWNFRPIFSKSEYGNRKKNIVWQISATDGKIDAKSGRKAITFPKAVLYVTHEKVGREVIISHKKCFSSMSQWLNGKVFADKIKQKKNNNRIIVIDYSFSLMCTSMPLQNLKIILTLTPPSFFIDFCTLPVNGRNHPNATLFFE